MEELNISAKKSLGQNFLISNFVIDKIIGQVQRTSCARIIEIGPGLGSLTFPVLEQMGKPMTLIELDRKIAQYWREQGLEVYEGDALRAPWESLFAEPEILLLGNLPYQISSSLVVEMSVISNSPSHMVLMFQKEVAQRIVADRGNKDYGLLSVIAQAIWEIHRVVDAGPKDFFPSPRVASRVLSFRRREEIPIEDRASFLYLLKRGFQQRRKKLVKNLGDEKLTVQEWLCEKGLTESLRAEQLSVDLWIELYNHLRS